MYPSMSITVLSTQLQITAIYTILYLYLNVLKDK